MAKKQTYTQQFDKLLKQLEKQLNKVDNKVPYFSVLPVPTKPKRVRKENVERLQTAVDNLRKINEAVSRLSKRGYVWIDDGTKIKRLQDLKKFQGEEIYKKADYIIQETGEVISGIEGRTYERKQAAKKVAETKRAKQQEANVKQLPTPQIAGNLPEWAETVIERAESELANIPDDLKGRSLLVKKRHSDEAIEFLQDCITEFGKETIAKRIGGAKEKGLWDEIVRKITQYFDPGTIGKAMHVFREILLDRKLTIEENRALTKQQERTELPIITDVIE